MLYILSIHKGNKRFQCNICDSKYTSKHGLLYHVTRVHDKIDKNFQCNICGKTFTSPNGLQYHLKSVHEGKKSFSCETCPKSFTSKQGLNYHIAKCTSSYKSKQGHKVHTEVHNRKKAKQDLIINSASMQKSDDRKNH